MPGRKDDAMQGVREWGYATAESPVIAGNDSRVAGTGSKDGRQEQILDWNVLWNMTQIRHFVANAGCLPQFVTVRDKKTPLSQTVV